MAHLTSTPGPAVAVQAGSDAETETQDNIITPAM